MPNQKNKNYIFLIENHKISFGHEYDEDKVDILTAEVQLKSCLVKVSVNTIGGGLQQDEIILINRSIRSQKIR